MITVENISKRYLIGHQVRHDTLRDSISHGVKNMLAALRSKARETREEFWALRDISFEVEAGDVVGIVGRNGAGKSTLLKVLSRITEPTSGRITLNGRVASLLEVGTGFHPELSGRENIFLNGAILGMTRIEIQRKFDEIVDFSGVEKFLDTPVKRYSSGMYVRLAFAVAAHLEPEILIVDEVLAVGDAQFQQKCLGKMQEIATNRGRTVLFVSHNLDSVARLCTRGLYLNSGRMEYVGSVEKTLSRYQHQSDANITPNVAFPVSQYTTNTGSAPYFISLEVINADRPTENFVSPGDRIAFELEIGCDRSLDVANIAVSILHPNSTPLINADSEKCGQVCALKNGKTRIRIDLGPIPLAPGDYPVHLWMANTRRGENYDSLVEGVLLSIVEKPGAVGLRPEHDGLLDLPFTVTVN